MSTYYFTASIIAVVVIKTLDKFVQSWSLHSSRGNDSEQRKLPTAVDNDEDEKNKAVGQEDLRVM